MIPSDLADLVLERNEVAIASAANVSTDWAEKIVEKLCYWNILFELQALSKQPKPIITVRTRSAPPKVIPVLQLSDGQRHTILLTIAMLAESNVPLVIDQPEDDLDNGFIFTSIVATLRDIKEKRQVILVTHNANIAVLGDSELILPMCREKDCGKAQDRIVEMIWDPSPRVRGVSVGDDAVRINVERDGGLEVLEFNITLPEAAGRQNEAASRSAG